MAKKKRKAARTSTGRRRFLQGSIALVGRLGLPQAATGALAARLLDFMWPSGGACPGGVVEKHVSDTVAVVLAGEATLRCEAVATLTVGAPPDVRVAERIA